MKWFKSGMVVMVVVSATQDRPAKGARLTVEPSALSGLLVIVFTRP